MLRPIDIQNKDFEKRLKGYNINQVDDFLDEIIRDYELLYKENETLKNKIALMTETIDRYRQMEKTMQRTIDAAEKTAEDIRKIAEKEAEAIIDKAKLDASHLARQIDDEHAKRRENILTMKNEIDHYRSKIKLICEDMIKLTEDME